MSRWIFRSALAIGMILFCDAAAAYPGDEVFHHRIEPRTFDQGAYERGLQALELCRDAVQKDASADNLAKLANAILSPDIIVIDSELEEAHEALARAEKLAPNDEFIASEQCELAVQQNKLMDLRACSARLNQIAPNGRSTIWPSWTLAMSEQRWGDAQEQIERAKAAHLPADLIANMQTDTDEAIPWTTHASRWAELVFGGWVALCASIAVMGLILSRITLRVAENWTPESAVRSAAVRAIYKQVLLLCSALYFVSLPLVLVLGFLLAAGTAGAFIYGMFKLGNDFGYASIKLGLMLMIAAYACGSAIIRSLFFRTTDEAPGVKLDLSREPEFVATLKEVADRIGTRTVDTVYLTPDTDLSVFERKGGERCLVLGAGVLEGFPLAAFKAILAHEYGHFSNRDTAGGGFALRVRKSLISLIVGLARAGHNRPWNVAWWFAKGYYRLFLRVSQGASRLQEILADRLAAEAYGGAAFAAGLRHLVSSKIKIDDHMNGEINRALEAEEPLSNLWSLPPTPESDTSVNQKLDEALNRKPSPYDSHPSLCDRIRWVAHLPAASTLETPNATAWALFREREWHEREVTLIMYQRLEASGVYPIALPAFERRL